MLGVSIGLRTHFSFFNLITSCYTLNDYDSKLISGPMTESVFDICIFNFWPVEHTIKNSYWSEKCFIKYDKLNTLYFLEKYIIDAEFWVANSFSYAFVDDWKYHKVHSSIFPVSWWHLQWKCKNTSNYVDIKKMYLLRTNSC